MVNEWTRDDLPVATEVVTAYLMGRGRGDLTTDVLSFPGVYAILDAVVEYLNTHHPKPEHPMSPEVERLRRERDEMRPAYDESVSMAYWAAKRLGCHVDDLDDLTLTEMAERVAAQPAPAVTRAGVKNAIDTCFALAPKINTQVISDAVCDFLGIEAEPADPVEELAGQIEAATRIAIRRACIDLATVAPPLDPLAIERAMEVTAASRKVAAHVLGQEASNE